MIGFKRRGYYVDRRNGFSSGKIILKDSASFGGYPLLDTDLQFSDSDRIDPTALRGEVRWGILHCFAY